MRNRYLFIAVLAVASSTTLAGLSRAGTIVREYPVLYQQLSPAIAGYPESYLWRVPWVTFDVSIEFVQPPVSPVPPFGFPVLVHLQSAHPNLVLPAHPDLVPPVHPNLLHHVGLPPNEAAPVPEPDLGGAMAAALLLMLTRTSVRRQLLFPRA